MYRETLWLRRVRVILLALKYFAVMGGPKRPIHPNCGSMEQSLYMRKSTNERRALTSPESIRLLNRFKKRGFIAHLQPSCLATRR
jgi:hypothetical protein